VAYAQFEGLEALEIPMVKPSGYLRAKSAPNPHPEPFSGQPGASQPLGFEGTQADFAVLVVSKGV